MNRFAPLPWLVALLLACLLLSAGCGVPAPPPTVAELRERAVGGEADAIKGLMAHLGREATTTTRSEAYLALLECGDLAAKAALDGARDRDPVRREHALALVGNLKPEGGFETARAALADPAFPRKHAAAWALGELRDERAIPLLVAVLQKDPAKGAGREEPELTGREAARALARFGPKSVAPLAEALGDIPGAPRGYAIRVLGELRDPRAQAALHGQTTDPAYRADAVWALGTLGRVGEPPDLTSFLDDPDWRVRVEASRSVGLLLTRRAAPALDRMRGNDPVAAVREWAARGLGLLEGHPMTYKKPDGKWVVPDDLYR